MGTQPSFQQILEEKIQAHSQEFASTTAFSEGISEQDPAHLAFLLGNLNATYWRPQATKAYPAKPKPAPRPHVLNDEQQLSFQFFQSHGAILSVAFTGKELKKAFRMLALRLHPDMNKGAQGPFIDLKKNYETLRALCPN
jgi:hypothetical protein